jgi:hypothetical protein
MTHSTGQQPTAKVTASRPLNDELRQIPDLLDAPRGDIVEKKSILTPKLEATRERLAKLGPTLAEGSPPESLEIAAQRCRHLGNLRLRQRS